MTKLSRQAGFITGWLVALGLGACSGTPESVCTSNSAAGATGTDSCTGGASSTGGANATGGSSATGGLAATGGSLATGGSALGTGGTESTGGLTSTGGALATGGTEATGGAPDVGGAPATGGTEATGGTPPTGGAPATGGAEPTGGTPATGGAATGGDVATGGTPATGGAATGGDVATGGAATGGDVATGGSEATGGSSSISPDDAFAAAPKFPAVGATNVPVDAWLNLTFDSPPTIGTAGHIYIRKVSDDSQVDVINLADSPSTVKIGSSYTSSASGAAVSFRSCTLGGTPATICSLADFGFNTTVNYLGNDAVVYGRATSRVRIVKYNPVRVSGNQLRIYPHDGALMYNTAYYVTIDNAAVTGTLSGTAFAGVTSKTAWTFTTKAAAPTGTAWTVNADGVSGNFMTVQGAINAVPYNNGNTNPIKVTVADGVYEELLSNYNKNYLTINGQSRAGTIIQFENYDTFLPGTGGWPTASSVTTPYTTPNGDSVTVPFGGTATLYEGGRPLYLLAATGTEINNLTVRNTHVKSTSISGNQAEALYFSTTTGKFISRDSNWISSQDTLQLKAYTWFYNCLVAGDVDFIWGVSQTNLFENCEIRTRVDPTSSAGGYVVNSRSAGTSPGFIFINSIFTAEAGVAAGSAYLARHNGTPATDSVVYSNCAIGPHINSTGFNGTPATGTPTAVLGLRYFGLKNPDSTPFDMTDNTSWDTSGLTTFYALSDPENTGLYGNRDKIFSGATVTYLTSSYPSIAWTLITTY